jgi:hypothetical protein
MTQPKKLIEVAMPVKKLYETPNRHLETAEIKAKEKALHNAIEN